MSLCQDHFHMERVSEESPTINHIATRYCNACICSFCDVCARVHDERYPEKPSIPIEERARLSHHKVTK